MAAREPGSSLTPALLYCAWALAAYFASSPLLLWTGLPLALLIAFRDPGSLILLMAITTPVFPVIRLGSDAFGAQQVSTKGLFFSADDPLAAALLVAWITAKLRCPHRGGGLFPGALAWLLLLYPLAGAANLFRLEANQWIVTGLYYCKWAQYALLVLAVPGVLAGSQASGMVARYRRAMVTAMILSAVFAGYETAEALRTGSYTSAYEYPRASSFFGSLNPARYGASEDPVNFGVYAVIAGSIALAGLGRRDRRTSSFAGIAAALAALVLSASRAPWLAAAAAFLRIYRVRSSRLLAGLAAISVLAAPAILVLPEILSANAARFSALRLWTDSTDTSALSRLQIAMNSPVFEFDQYWLIGHGHSSYRFVAEEHLSKISRGVTRSLYNFPLMAWYDAGPAGLLFWILLFRQLSTKLARIGAASPSEEVRTLASGLRGALWAVAISSLFGEVPYNWRVMGVFYSAVGVCLASDAAARRAWSRRGALSGRGGAAWLTS
jgi:hypothetical protein